MGVSSSNRPSSVGVDAWLDTWWGASRVRGTKGRHVRDTSHGSHVGRESHAGRKQDLNRLYTRSELHARNGDTWHTGHELEARDAGWRRASLIRAASRLACGIRAGCVGRRQATRTTRASSTSCMQETQATSIRVRDSGYSVRACEVWAACGKLAGWHAGRELGLRCDWAGMPWTSRPAYGVYSSRA